MARSIRPFIRSLTVLLLCLVSLASCGGSRDTTPGVIENGRVSEEMELCENSGAEPSPPALECSGVIADDR